MFRLALLALLCVGIEAQADCNSCVQQKKYWCPSTKACGAKTEDCDIIPIDRDLNCPRTIDPKYAYNDTFARAIVAPITSALYSFDEGAKCFKNVLPTMVMYKSIRVLCADDGKPEYEMNCHVLVLYDPTMRAIVLAFQGTNSLTQLEVEFESFLLHRKVDFLGIGKVLGYFHDAFYYLWNGGLQQALSTVQFEHPGYELWVFGHSLGGAIAALQAAYAVHEGLITSDKIKLYTCGEPRTGDYSYATWMSNNIYQNYRIIHNKDVVPHIPPRLGGDVMFHHHNEVWYPNDMAVGDPYQVCEEADGDYCSNTQKDTSGKDHVFYFHKLLFWAEEGCQ